MAPVPEKLQAGSFPISTQKGQSSHQHFLRPLETMQIFKLGQGLSRFRGNFQGSQEIAAILPGNRGVLSRAKSCSQPKYFHSHSCLGGHTQTVPRAMRRFASPFQLVQCRKMCHSAPQWRWDPPPAVTESEHLQIRAAKATASQLL